MLRFTRKMLRRCPDSCVCGQTSTRILDAPDQSDTESVAQGLLGSSVEIGLSGEPIHAAQSFLRLFGG
jgi:hypothetical protein